MALTHAYRYEMGLSIAGSPIPDPKGYTVIRSDLDTIGKRNAKGKLVRNMVASKYKVELTYENIDFDMIKAIGALVQGKSKMKFTFIDPFTNTLETITAYVGDRTSDSKWVSETVGIRMGSLKVNFIEI